MTSRAHCKFLIAALLTSGCQSTGSVMPWSASKDPVYSSAELAALDAPQPLASTARFAEKESSPPVNSASNSSGNQQVSSTMPVSAGNVDELVRRGQATIREAGQDNPVKLQQARDILSQALALDGTNTSAHHSMAIVADLQKDWQAAEFHYKHALQARPQDASLLNDIGCSYLLQNRFHEATQYLNQTLQIQPRHERAHVNLALLSLKRGDRAGAQNRLAGIYSAADAQTTLARLESDLQATGAIQPTAVAMANAPMSGFGDQAPQQFNPQQSQNQNQNQNQNAVQYGNPNQDPNSGQMAQSAQPVHVYPAGVELSPEEISVGANPQNYPTTGSRNVQPNNFGAAPYSAMSGQSAHSQTPQSQQYGSPPGAAVSQYNPNGLNPASEQNQFGTVQNTNPQSANGPPNQFGVPQGLLQQMNPPQPMNSAAYSSGMNAPLAGLNVGPGALFPIDASPNYGAPRPQGNQHPQYAVNPKGQSGYPTVSFPAMQNGATYPTGNNMMPPEQQMQIRNSAAQPQQNYQYNTQPASSPQYPPQNGAVYQQGSPGASVQQYGPAPQATPYLGNTNGAPAGQPRNASPLAASPLAAYEQQLQNLDSRYNQAVQQMDGNGMPLGAAQGQFR
mgnify:FL=1